jgi:carbamoyltransferase
MQNDKKDVYVLGTGLSHDGSACLLKNGKIQVAIEKERITRKKHDGGSDYESIMYCLDKEGITIFDVDLIVQNSNMGLFKNGNSYFRGSRMFDSSLDVPIVSISHHMAHAYYALGTSPYEETAVLVIDGCGSSYDDCLDIGESTIVGEQVVENIRHMYFEKDSFYQYRNGNSSVFTKISHRGDIRLRNILCIPTLPGIPSEDSITGLHNIAWEMRWTSAN